MLRLREDRLDLIGQQRDVARSKGQASIARLQNASHRRGEFGSCWHVVHPGRIRPSIHGRPADHLASDARNRFFAGSVYIRHNNDVITFVPDHKVAWTSVG